MKDSIKANLIIFFIIAIIAFSLSSVFANLTVKEETDSYKLIQIENNSFEPNYIEEVPTIETPVNKTNTTNVTNTYNYTDTNYNNTDYSNTYSNSYSSNNNSEN